MKSRTSRGVRIGCQPTDKAWPGLGLGLVWLGGLASGFGLGVWLGGLAFAWLELGLARMEPALSFRAGTPNSKPHLMVARGAMVNPDIGVTLFRESLDARNSHFFPAPAFGQFGTAGHQQTLKCRHGATHLQSEDNLSSTTAMHKSNFYAQA